MGRSVSYPTGSVVAFRLLDDGEVVVREIRANPGTQNLGADVRRQLLDFYGH